MRIRQANHHGYNAVKNQAKDPREPALSKPFCSGIALRLILSVMLGTSLAACHPAAPSRTRVKDLSSYTQVPVATPADHAVLHDAMPAKAEANPNQENPWLIVPGIKVGEITAQTTLADLQRLYGPANVKPGQVPGPEGTRMPGAIVFPAEPQKKLIVYWKIDRQHSEKASPKVSSVVIQGHKSLWHTHEDIKLGTTLTELEQLNGGPFMMSGMDWAYGGIVLSWGDQGKLREKFQKAGGLAIQLSPPQNTHGGYELVEGKKTFSSGNEALQRLNPQVFKITVFLQ